MQHLCRSDRTGAQDHFAFCAGLDDFAALNETHAGGAALLDDQAIDQHIFFETQIGTRQRGFQKASRRRPAASALLVDVEIADALIVAGIEIRNFPDTHFFRGIADRVQNGPGQPWGFDPPAAADAVMLAWPKKMVFEPPERRLDVIPAPARQAKLTPVVIVGGLPAHRDHRVNGGRAADHLAAGIGQRAAVETGFRLGPKHPVRTRIADRKEIADRDVKPDPVVVAAGLQDQDAARGIGRQPVGDDAAGGAGADDDIVEITLKLLHKSSPRAHFWALAIAAHSVAKARCTAARGVLDKTTHLNPVIREFPCPSSIASPICNPISMPIPSYCTTCTALRHSSRIGCGSSAATKSPRVWAVPAWSASSRAANPR